MERKTKIIATLGPVSSNPEVILEMVSAGMDVARLNFSHGSHEDHQRVAAMVREASSRAKKPVALLQDIQGPKIRVGLLVDGELELPTGESVKLRPGKGKAIAGEILIDYERLLEDIEPGHQVYLADGMIRLVVAEKLGDHLRADIKLGGVLSDRKGVAFPDTELRAPILTEKDGEDLAFGREIGVDFVAASFVQSAEDVQRVISRVSEDVQVIAKIELAVAYQRLNEILSVAHGIMVARGDLGVQIPLQKIPLVQQDILERTNRHGRISVTATEMLESMTHSSRPTRAEVTDVATAVMAGTDAVMLSGETAVGDYPARSIEVMDIITREIETGHAARSSEDIDFMTQAEPIPSAAARAAVQAADSLDIQTIIVFSESGDTGRLLSKYRPKARIIALTPNADALGRMSLLWGVIPRLFPRMTSTDVMINAAERMLLFENICEPGDSVIMVAGVPPGQRSSTNLVKIHQVRGSGGQGH